MLLDRVISYAILKAIANEKEEWDSWSKTPGRFKGELHNVYPGIETVLISVYDKTIKIVMNNGVDSHYIVRLEKLLGSARIYHENGKIVMNYTW